MATGRVRRSRAVDTEHIEESKVTVTVQPFGKEAEAKQEVIEVHKFITEPAYVRVSAGVTKSTGNYESLRIDVSYTIPCYKEQISDKFYAAISDAVAERLDSEINQYLQLADED
jgi:hypothetical protein